ncbi:MAG: hypothetical protein KDD38_08280, partial [Bdellovibrionales bacterium]|nr:hypothetical protein [Bdellovibrionales bacterium]
ILAIFIFIGGLFLEGERGANEQSSVMPTAEMHELGSTQAHNKKMQQRKILKRLDYDLKDSAIRDELKRFATEAENEASSSVDENAALENSSHLENINPLVFDQENAGQRVLRDTEDARVGRGRPLTPEQRIAAKIERDLWSQDYETRQRAEFVKQFLENARKNGVDIRLNDNLDVTGIDRFEVEAPIRFPQSDSSGARGGNK